VAERIAREEFGIALRWAERESRDTRENAARSVGIARQAGIDHLIIVTHDWHMPRALRAFRRAADGALTVEAAPLGLSGRQQMPSLPWLPSTEGLTHVRQVMHELIGLAAGA
jgi:uncharacterized SAM-binding protein YcdF (DUF218 family)